MTSPTTIHNTFVIERSYSKPPERVFAALADAAQKRRWFAEGDHHDVQEYTLDFRVGGVERASYRFREGTPFPGVELASEGHFLDIVPDRRVVAASTMTLGGRRISTSLLTFELVPTAQGTDLLFTDQTAFFEGADGPKMREGGWRSLIERLSTELAR